MIKSKRSAEQQVADELEPRALHPLSSRQTISDSQAEPEFHANHKRLTSRSRVRTFIARTPAPGPASGHEYEDAMPWPHDEPQFVCEGCGDLVTLEKAKLKDKR
jgi:hypothetical protein